MEIIKNTTPTLCLNMIVKNESKIITRLFDSLLSIIDCYCICDTGSTDNTKEIITEYFKNKNIPGKLIDEPFKNFCYNRNVALEACLNMSDYILLMDADMILEITNFNKSDLINTTNISILQGNDSFFYKNTRIIKNTGLYKYKGVTHEYIDFFTSYSIESLNKNQLFIRDLGDGGSKDNKLERDIELLLNGIKEEPENVRYYFYLANSYYDSSKFDYAIDYYKKRIELGGWKEEVWYSYYRIGLSFRNINKINDAIQYWLDGYNFYPERIENLYEIIKYYRITSKHKLCNMIYQETKKILNLNHNRENYLFLYDEIYTSKIFYEYTIFAAYIGINNINNEVIQVFNNSKDQSDINNMLNNMKFYKDTLTSISKIIFDNNITFNVNNENVKFISSSSCLLPNNSNNSNNGYKMNIRYVNYYITEKGYYLNCDKHVITVNKYIEFDNKMNIINEKWEQINYNGRQYIGVEDLKLFNDIETSNLLFIGSGFHSNNRIGIVTGNYDINNLKLNYQELIPSFNNSFICEKNWVFVDYNNETHIIYAWYPLQICKINYNTSELYLVETKKMPQIFSRIRGSSCGFKYLKNENTESEIWFITHMVSYEEPRHYYHLIVIFDSNLNLLRYSAPFKFEGQSIEYSLSILVEDERVLINYSTLDRTTRIGIYDKKYIDSIVKYSFT
jgi:glycosyltransferase involved in cell wall biosynthesis